MKVKYAVNPDHQKGANIYLSKITVWTWLLLMFWYNRLLPQKIIQTWATAAKRVIRRHESIAQMMKE